MACDRDGNLSKEAFLVSQILLPFTVLAELR